MGDKLLLKLNIYGKPIANKYCEGKMKRTLKRGLKDLKSLKGKSGKSTRLNSSHTVISYAVFCLKKKKTTKIIRMTQHR